MVRGGIILLTLALGACTVPSSTVNPFCDISEPIRFNSSEVAAAVVRGDRAVANQIDAHNRYGERVCGW